jgi:prevent-host-death family protein
VRVHARRRLHLRSSATPATAGTTGRPHGVGRAALPEGPHVAVRAEFGAMIGAMDLSSDIEPVTALKRSAADLIARATDRHSPIVITQNGKPTAVLQDVHSYQRQQRALHLLKLLAQGEQDHRAGRVHDQASVDGLVAARLAERRGAS